MDSCNMYEELALYVNQAPTGWYTHVHKLDEPFTELVKIAGCEALKLVDLKDASINDRRTSYASAWHFQIV